MQVKEKQKPTKSHVPVYKARLTSLPHYQCHDEWQDGISNSCYVWMFFDNARMLHCQMYQVPLQCHVLISYVSSDCEGTYKQRLNMKIPVWISGTNTTQMQLKGCKTHHNICRDVWDSDCQDGGWQYGGTASSMAGVQAPVADKSSNAWPLSRQHGSAGEHLDPTGSQRTWKQHLKYPLPAWNPITI